MFQGNKYEKGSAPSMQVESVGYKVNSSHDEKGFWICVKCKRNKCLLIFHQNHHTQPPTELSMFLRRFLNLNKKTTSRMLWGEGGSPCSFVLVLVVFFCKACVLYVVCVWENCSLFLWIVGHFLCLRLNVMDAFGVSLLFIPNSVLCSLIYIYGPK